MLLALLLALLGVARLGGLLGALRGNESLVGTGSVGLLLKLSHLGVGHLDRVHGEPLLKIVIDLLKDSQGVDPVRLRFYT
ncbi:hypothetical protein [Streptomyces venezuelae]|uniref:hypothetical protein n=1 Tax=Streptomyces venezuelae TaxID=54571 RepID=UPI001680D928|nr:hypothetical protein [Streptomyces venezuelae]